MKLLKVYLNIYDFVAINGCLAAVGIGGYHTGIEIDDGQYCYCVVSTDPKETGVIIIEPQTAQYHFNRKVFLGEVEMMDYRFRQIEQQLRQQFTCGKYHMFNFNCNHFSDHFAKRLLNVRLPDWIFRATNILSVICCWLPHGCVSGQWALQSLLEEERTKDDKNRQLCQI